ncbi:uncharacterized protein LOC142616404 [Castanea sativa]|uniref:uncharacterized protein LOC142616404 n=1 Tax=Castanea sativa TaxID=21020 RepID=UPI003F64A108
MISRYGQKFPRAFFPVRSAYRVALELKNDGEIGSCSDGSNLRPFWRGLWSIQIPHKIRHFAWRAARDILTTEENLVARKVLVDSRREECGVSAKSFYHLFWECSKARDTWARSTLFTSLSLVPFRSFFDFLWHIIMDANWGMEDVGLAVTIAWALWTNRNNVHYRKPRKAGLMLKAAGAGVIVRDHEGKFVAGLSKKIHAPLGTVEAKAKANEAGIIFAKEVGIKEFVLEGDSLIIVQALKECSYAPSTVSHLIYGIQMIAKSLGMWLSLM